LRAQLRHANVLGARYALVLGAKELADGTITLRDLSAASQQTLPIDEVTHRLAATSG
jgi:histidyl-tRNA synthetase